MLYIITVYGFVCSLCFCYKGGTFESSVEHVCLSIAI